MDTINDVIVLSKKKSRVNVMTVPFAHSRCAPDKYIIKTFNRQRQWIYYIKLLDGRLVTWSNLTRLCLEEKRLDKGGSQVEGRKDLDLLPGCDLLAMTIVNTRHGSDKWLLLLLGVSQWRTSRMAIGTRVHKDESARESNYWLSTSHVNGAGHTGACTIFVPPVRGWTSASW